MPDARSLGGRWAGIRKHEPLLEFFEKVVNLVRQHAPDAAIAFNSTRRTAPTPLCGGCASRG